MSLEYSRGFTATVSRLDTDSPYYDTADLVRVEIVRDFRWFERLFIRHKIASQLYPDNFISVVGVSNRPNFPTGTNYVTNLYSKEANIPPEHATYSAHYAITTKPTLAERYRQPLPLSLCQCDVCTDHSRFHQDNNLESQAVMFGSDLREDFGITLPVDDPTDYCLSPKGLMFFEVETFNSFLFLNKITHHTHPDKSYLIWMLTKYSESINHSTLNSPSGAVRFF